MPPKTPEASLPWLPLQRWLVARVTAVSNPFVLPGKIDSNLRAYYNGCLTVLTTSIWQVLLLLDRSQPTPPPSGRQYTVLATNTYRYNFSIPV